MLPKNIIGFAVLGICFPIVIHETQACRYGKNHESVFYECPEGRRQHAATSDFASEFAPDVNSALSDFFTECMQRHADKTLKSWRSVIDFVIRDTLWFEVTDLQNCPEKNNTPKKYLICWQEHLHSLLNSSSWLLPKARYCLRKYLLSSAIKSPSSAIPTNEARKGSYAIRDKCLKESITTFDRCLGNGLSSTANGCRYPSLQNWDAESVNTFLVHHVTNCRLTTIRRGRKLNYVESCYHEEDICLTDIYKAVVKPSSPLYLVQESCSIAAYAPVDCSWQAFGQYGLCDKVRDGTGSYAFRKMRERKKIPALNGGADCVGKNYDYVPCTSGEYTSATFLRTVAAKLIETEGGGRRMLDTSKKCVEDEYDENGVLVMSGRKCTSSGRKRRGVSESAGFKASRTKRQAPLSINNRDVLFMLDESGSIGPSNFKKLVRLAKAITNSFCEAISVRKNGTRVGVLNFDKAVHPEIDFDKYFQKATLLTGMDNDVEFHKGTSGRTCLVDALQYSKDSMFTSQRGARVNVPGTERIVILVTDGCANCKPGNLKKQLQDMGEKFSAQGIPIITFLVTGDPGRCFNIMKGLSDGSHCYQQFHAPTWARFDETIETIENSPCMDAWYIGPSC